MTPHARTTQTGRPSDADADRLNADADVRPKDATDGGGGQAGKESEQGGRARRRTKGWSLAAGGGVGAVGDDSTNAVGSEGPHGARVQNPDEPALDSTQNYRWAPPLTCDDVSSRERRNLRWKARSALWKASTLKPVRSCGAQLHDRDGESVGVRKDQAQAGYAGLMTCGSPWACPRCSAVIAWERSAEIGRAVEKCHAEGGATYMATFTMRHHAGDDLGDLWDALSEGWSSVFRDERWTGRKARTRKGKNGRTRHVPAVVGDREKYGVAGTVRSIEATYGRPELGGHGWHLHVHALIFTDAPLGSVMDPETVARLLAKESVTADDCEVLATGSLGSSLFARWADGVEKAGLPRPLSSGFDLRRIHDGGADFIGSYLAKSTLDVATRIGAEVAAGRNTKTSRSAVNVTPFELLDDLMHSEHADFGFRTPRSWIWAELPDGTDGIVDLDTGEVTELHPPGEWRVWMDWERASKGRRQILWSQRRKDPQTPLEQLWNAILDARGEVQTDEQIADQEVDGSTVAHVMRESWYRRMVWRPALITDLLDVVEDSPDDESATVNAVAWGEQNAVQVLSPQGIQLRMNQSLPVPVPLSSA